MLLDSNGCVLGFVSANIFDELIQSSWLSSDNSGIQFREMRVAHCGIEPPLHLRQMLRTGDHLNPIDAHSAARTRVNVPEPYSLRAIAFPFVTRNLTPVLVAHSYGRILPLNTSMSFTLPSGVRVLMC